jgi:hypothetical protein
MGRLLGRKETGPRVNRLLLVLLGLVLTLSCGAAWSQGSGAGGTKEFDIKTGFVYNFMQFVEWPAGTFKDTFVVGTLGKDDYGDSLPVLTHHAVGASPITLQRLTSVDQAAQCQALIIMRSETDHLGQILAALKGKPVLTISDDTDFAAKGGCIGFVYYRSRLKFEINTDALKRDNLKCNSRLLSLATIVTGGQ